MKNRKKSAFCILAISFLTSLAFVNDNSQADEPDPLTLPCTIGATATKINPITKHNDKFLCEKCGSETCWIQQPN